MEGKVSFFPLECRPFSFSFGNDYSIPMFSEILGTEGIILPEARKRIENFPLAILEIYYSWRISGVAYYSTNLISGIRNLNEEKTSSIVQFRPGFSFEGGHLSSSSRRKEKKFSRAVSSSARSIESEKLSIFLLVVREGKSDAIVGSLRRRFPRL